MTERESSKTALGVAILRAVHQLLDATPRILDAPLVLQLLGPSVVDGIRANPAPFQTPPSIGLRSHIVIRSRYAEDRLEQAVQRGIGQFLSLGAGFDTFPYRQPTWARRLRLFEVDHPATQQEKRARLRAAGIPTPPNLEFVPIDFEVTSLSDGLRASHFDFSQPTFFAWLGVMVYLSQEAADAVFKFVAQLPSSSEIVFTFSSPRTNEETVRRPYPSLAERVAQLDEPFKNYTAPDALVSHLHELGFAEITIPTQTEIEVWYIKNRQDKLHALQRRTLASAVV